MKLKLKGSVMKIDSVFATSGLFRVAWARIAMMVALVLPTLQLRAFGQTIGPDAVANPTEISNSPFDAWGCNSNVQAYTMRGGVSNIGDEELPWDLEEDHPMWTSNFYRLDTTTKRFEQIGQSWIKHDSWDADSDSYAPCDTVSGCTNSSNGLDPGCSDIYNCANGFQNESGRWLGPRYEVNPWTGAQASQTKCDAANNGLALACRLQVKKSDINSATYPSNTTNYFLEQQVIMPGESTAVRWNNVAHREATIGNCLTGACTGSICQESRTCNSCAPSGGSNCIYEITPVDSPSCTEPAIYAWKDIDSNVVETPPISVPSDGQFILAARAWNVSGTLYAYEYALYNMDSNQGADSFAVPLPTDLCAEDLTNIEAYAGFHDIDYHSGEEASHDGTDWDWDATSGSLTWTIHSGSTNALSWGTLYNFRFFVHRAPNDPSNNPKNVTIGLYGSSSTVSGASLAPVAATSTHRACCYDGDSCMLTTECYCDDIGGGWVSGSTTCLSSPCAMRPGE